VALTPPMRGKNLHCWPGGRTSDLRMTRGRAGVAPSFIRSFNLVSGAGPPCENIFLGQEPTRAGFSAETAGAVAGCGAVSAAGSQDRSGRPPAARLTTAQQQLVEIAKALVLDARIIVMDEPSAGAHVA